MSTSIYDQPTEPGAEYRKRLYCDCPPERVAFTVTIHGLTLRICGDHVEAIAARLGQPRASLNLIPTLRSV